MGVRLLAALIGHQIGASNYSKETRATNCGLIGTIFQSFGALLEHIARRSRPTGPFGNDLVAAGFMGTTMASLT